MRYSGRARKAAFKLILFWLIAGAVVWFLVTLTVMLATLVTAVAVAVTPVLLVLFALFALFTLYFFRDPNARVPTGAGLVVAPAHAKVDVIDTVSEAQFMGGECQRISMFLSIFDVHVQNAPVSGKVALLKYTQGQFLNAIKTESALYNENVLLGFEASEPRGQKVGVRLIAGVIARRIVPFVQQGDEVARGDRVSLIQFGSRADVYLPRDAKIKVKLGDKVVGGTTVLAVFEVEKAGVIPVMKDPSPESGNQNAVEPKLKIYFLPNLLTAGNLFCGFVALTKIVEADISTGNFHQIQVALGFILLACIFDLFDGRVARMGGIESPFGREFDSLADLISFGVAPAFLVHRVVLKGVFEGHPEWGWFIASIYLICGAFRLARFNCLATQPGGGGGREFLGFPIPSAAGLVASLTLLIIQLNEKDKDLGKWSYLLALVLVFLSAMMVSTVKYPSFKSLGLRSTSTFTKAIVAALFLGLILVLQERILYYVLPAFFTAYLVYGFIRPRISRQMRREIEEEDEEEEEGPDTAPGGGM